MELVAAAIDAGPTAAALLLALDNHRRIRTLSERLRRSEKG